MWHKFVYYCDSMIRTMKNVCRNFSYGNSGMMRRGRCSQDESHMIRNVWEQVHHNIDHPVEATIRVDVFLNDKFRVEETPQAIRLHAWTTELINKHRGQGHFLHQMGFFFTARQPTHEQEFHLDHHPEAETFFIPLVPVSIFNYTSSIPYDSAPTVTGGLRDDFDLLRRENMDLLNIMQVICREYTILHSLKGNVLRSIKN